MFKTIRDFLFDKIWFPIKYWLFMRLEELPLQIVGYTTTWLVYVALIVCKLAGIALTDNVGHFLWVAAALFAGVPELILIFVFSTTITKFGRGLLKKSLDTILMVGLTPVTWAFFGPVVALIGFVHFLSSHYGEKQLK